MNTAEKKWKSFEDVFWELLHRHRDFFDLEEIEPGPTQVVGKARRVRPWDIEVVGYKQGTRRLVLFECKLRTRNVEPDPAGEFAYRVLDTGAETGYFVTALDKGLSAGAQELADYAQIGHIRVARESTPDDYVMRCADNLFVGISDVVHFTEEGRAVIARNDGSESQVSF